MKGKKPNERIRRPRHGKRGLHGRVPSHNVEATPTQIGGGKTDGTRRSLCITVTHKLSRNNGGNTS